MLHPRASFKEAGATMSFTPLPAQTGFWEVLKALCVGPMLLNMVYNLYGSNMATPPAWE